MHKALRVSAVAVGLTALSAMIIALSCEAIDITGRTVGVAEASKKTIYLTAFGDAALVALLMFLAFVIATPRSRR
jgi:hypothetical protein